MLLVAPLRGSHELAAVLATVAVGAGPEVSKTCSKLVSVSSSFDGSSEASDSSTAGASAAGASSAWVSSAWAVSWVSATGSATAACGVF